MTTPLRRQDFPVASDYVYLNHAGVNALPTPVVAAMDGWARRAAAQGSLTVDADEGRMEAVRQAGARLMGVGPEDVAFVKNTTEGLGFVANGLEWEPGDRVVVPEREFPSAFYPWKALEDRGVVVDTVPTVGRGHTVPVAAFGDVIAGGRPPKVVATSWVQFGRGWRTDLAALAAVAHDVGALLCADVIQGLGVLPAHLGAWGVDFAAADAHKWLLGPPGIGFLYVRASRLESLRVLEPGWASVSHREEWDNLALTLDSTARRLEGGTANVAGVHGLGAALDILEAAGVETIWDHVDRLCDRLCSGLADVGVEVLSDRSDGGRSGIVTFAVDPRPPDEVVERLLERRMVCSARGGGVRVSPHGYTGEDDIDAFLAALASIVRS